MSVISCAALGGTNPKNGKRTGSRHRWTGGRCDFCGRTKDQVLDAPPRVPLIQEGVSLDLHYPWRVLVCCALLNQTTRAQVRPIIDEFFRRAPGPEQIADSYLMDILTPLGLQHRRLVLLICMTEDYLAGVSPYECYGAGHYARDALDLLCAGRTDIEPADHVLKPYLEWRKEDELRNAAPEWDEAGYVDWACRRPVR